METEETKTVRFSLMMQILRETAAMSNNEVLRNWQVKIDNQLKNKEKNYNDFYNEVDEFFKSNYDLLHLFILLKNQCQAQKIPIPLPVYCSGC